MLIDPQQVRQHEIAIMLACYQVDVGCGVGCSWCGERGRHETAAAAAVCTRESAELWSDDRPGSRAGKVLRSVPDEQGDVQVLVSNGRRARKGHALKDVD